jgi:putative serine protease PepD
MTDRYNPWNQDGEPRPQGQPSADAPQGQPSANQPQYPGQQGQQYPAGQPRPDFHQRPYSQPSAPAQDFGPRPYGPGHHPGSGPGGQQPTQFGARPGPDGPKRGGGKLAAAFVGVAVLAAGVGAGSAVVADRYLDDAQPAASASAQPAPSNSSRPVVQADANAPDWSAVADVASQSVVAIQVRTAQGGGQGSGVIIDEEGNIITNNHVVNGAAQILVTLGDQSFEAELVGTDPSTDLAVIKLTDPPSDLQPMAIGDSNALVVGDPVMAIGNPLGLSGTVTTGIVSALDRPVTTQAVGSQDRDTVVTAAIQTNAAINPGNSGGALVNSSGELVGITTSIATLSGSPQGGAQSGNIGIGFAIGSDQAKNIAEQLIKNGEAQHPQVGVTARDVQQVGPMGAQVVEVVPDSPAAGAGLQSGDVITAVNDRTVSSTSQLVGLVRAQKIGEPITVTYIRGGEEQTVELTPVAANR